MSTADTKAPAAKKSLADKLATGAAIGAGIAAAAAVIPQDEVAKRGIPGLWEALTGFLEERWVDVKNGYKEFRPVAFAWGAKLWFYLKMWLGISAMLLIMGIEAKSRFGWDFGHVLVAASTLSFIGLGIVLFALSEGIATILYFKVRLAGGVLKKAAGVVGIELPTPTAEELKARKERIEKLHGRLKMILAGTTVLGFSLIFTMFFPAWSTLGWTMLIWAPVAVGLCAAIYLDLKMGKAVMVLFYASIVLVVGITVVFLLDRITGGAIGFAPVREWVRKWNGTEVIWGLQALIIVGLLMKSGFAKDKDGKPDENGREAFRKSAKYLAIAFVVLDVLLLYKGTMSWKDGTGNEAPKAVQEVIEKAETASFKDVDLSLGGPKKAEARSDHQRTATSNGGGHYLSPPSVDPMPKEEAPAPRTEKAPRAKKPPLPPLKAKKYENAATAIDDLESLL